ncbi:MAG: hypothetical protein JWO67_13 [Streptosporangiaceae bacterium]|nr:hypothetical protein [Streptosporangiaceae bacterium]
MSGGAYGWPQRLLQAAGLPVTATNVTFLALWSKAEGGNATYNPLNTTQPAAGASNYNSVGVKNYPNEAAGLQATAATLHNGRYDQVLAALQKSDMKAAARAVVASPWGTGPQLLTLVGDAGGNAIPQGPTGGVATGVANGVADTAKASVKGVSDLVGALASRSTWVRVVEVGAGIGMVVLGVVMLNKGTVAGAVKAVGSATPGAVAAHVITKAPAAAAGAL